MVQLVPSAMWQSLIGRWMVEAPSDMGAGLYQENKKKKQTTIYSNRVRYCTGADEGQTQLNWLISLRRRYQKQCKYTNTRVNKVQKEDCCTIKLFP